MKVKLPCRDSLVIIGLYSENTVDISYCASLGEKIKKLTTSGACSHTSIQYNKKISCVDGN
jgi:hypothetical protein